MHRFVYSENEHCVSGCVKFCKSESEKFAYGKRKTHLHNVFYQCLVGANLGSLQSADILADPGDEGELGTLAHGVARRDPHKTKETSVIWE